MRQRIKRGEHDARRMDGQFKQWIFWIPTGISLLSVIFSAALWSETREQRKLAFDATLVFDVDTLQRQHRIGIAVRNIGPGVASIRSVSYYFDGQTVDDPDGMLNQAHFGGVEMDPGDSMAAGEQQWLVDYHAMRKEDESIAIDFVEKHLAVTVEYCTSAGDCKRACSRKGGCIQKRSVALH